MNYAHLYYLALVAVCLYNVGKIWNKGHQARTEPPGPKTVVPGVIQAVGSVGLLAITPERLPVWLAPALVAAAVIYMLTVLWDRLSGKPAMAMSFYLRACAYTVAGLLVLYGLYVAWQ